MTSSVTTTPRLMLASVSSSTGSMLICQAHAVHLAAHGCAQVIEQPGEIFVQRHRAHVARAVEPLVDERDRKNAVLRFRQGVLWRPDLRQRLRLQVHQGRDQGQAVGDPVIDLRQQHFGPIARLRQVLGAVGDALLKFGVERVQLSRVVAQLPGVARNPDRPPRQPRRR